MVGVRGQLQVKLRCKFVVFEEVEEMFHQGGVSFRRDIEMEAGETTHSETQFLGTHES